MLKKTCSKTRTKIYTKFLHSDDAIKALKIAREGRKVAKVGFTEILAFNKKGGDAKNLVKEKF